MERKDERCKPETDEPGQAKCPQCGLDVAPGAIRCPRCHALLLTGCSGSCASCRVAGCATRKS